MRTRQWRKFNNLINNVLAVICSLIVVCILIEVMLHLWDPFEFRVKGDKIVLPKNRHYVIKNSKIHSSDEVIVHTKNSLGFRGENPPENFADYLTIISIGGSTAECFYLSDDKTWPEALGRELRKDFKNVWINNAGLDGCSCRAHLVLLKDYIVKLKPKVVIFIVGANDVWLQDANNYDDQIRLQNVGVFKKVLQKSEIYNLGLNLSRYWEARTLKIAHSSVNLKTLEHISIPQDEITSLLKLHQDHYVQSYEGRLSSLVNICHDNSIQPVFITQPSLFGEGMDPITGANLETAKIEKGLNGQAYWRLLELYNDATRKIASTHGVWLLDLAREMPKSSDYFYDTLHFTNAGAQKVAEIIYPKLSQLMAAKFRDYQINRN